MSTVDVSPEHPLNDITAVATSVQLVDHRIVLALMPLSRNLEAIAHANDEKVSGRWSSTHAYLTLGKRRHT